MTRTIEIEASVPKDYLIKYWYDKDQEMPESEQEHVNEMIERGFTSGELVYDLSRGWWNIG